MDHIPTITSTIVQLAHLAVITYGIASARAFLIHWLDNLKCERCKPLIFQRTDDEVAVDEARRGGLV